MTLKANLESKGETKMAEKSMDVGNAGTEYKTIIRVVGEHPDITKGVYPVASIDGYISSFLKDGWRVLSVNFLEKIVEGYIFSWHLVKY